MVKDKTLPKITFDLIKVTSHLGKVVRKISLKLVNLSQIFTVYRRINVESGNRFIILKTF